MWVIIFDMLGVVNNVMLLESFFFCVVVGVFLIGFCLLGVGLVSLIYGYVIMFDFLRCLGYCNVEIFFYKVFEIFLILWYFIYILMYVVNVYFIIFFEKYFIC